MELTNKQLERQDFVDNKIMALLQEVNPTGQSLQWDIEVIGEIRDIVANYFKEKGICSEEEFYPTVELLGTHYF